MFRLKKQKIFLIYQYFILNKEIDEGALIKCSENETLREWFRIFLTKEAYLKDEINKKLKEGWLIERMPPLENALLFYTFYEILINDLEITKLIIDQTLNFSKAYLDKEKYKYINKILDLFLKEKNRLETVKSDSRQKRSTNN